MRYPGGKGGAGVYQAIINQIPPHDTYIEPFAGHAAVARHKRPARRTVLVDLDPAPLAVLQGALPAAELVNADALAWLDAYPWTGREFVYADPPYWMASRRSPRRLYRCEIEAAGHLKLLDLLKRLPCPVAVSGYNNPVYAAALADWRLVRFTAMTRAGPAEECLWCNFPAPAALHDFRYLGADYRQRERIARKVRRWRARFAALPELERLAVLSGILSPETAVSDSVIAAAGGADVATAGAGDAGSDLAASGGERSATADVGEARGGELPSPALASGPEINGFARREVVAPAGFEGGAGRLAPAGGFPVRLPETECYPARRAECDRRGEC